MPGRLGLAILALALTIFVLLAPGEAMVLRDAWWNGLARVMPRPAEMVRPAVMPWLEAGAILALGLFVTVLIPRSRPAPALRLIAGLGLALAAVSALGFSTGLLVDAATPLLMTGVVALGVMGATLVERDRVRLNRQVQLFAERADRAMLQGELDAAARLQRSLLPAADWRGGGVEVACHIRPAETVGGDFYDHMVVADGRLFFLVADVSGHGTDASQFMLISKTLLKSVALRAEQPLAALIAAANTEIARENTATMFVTAVAGLLDPSDGRLAYVGAGHEMPWLLASDGSVVRLPEATGPPLGLKPDAEWKVGRIELAPGDRLVLFTDGVTEAAAADGALWGGQALEAELRGVPEGADSAAVRRHLVARLETFTAGTAQADDQTLMVVGLVKRRNE